MFRLSDDILQYVFQFLDDPSKMILTYVSSRLNYLIPFDKKKRYTYLVTESADTLVWVLNNIPRQYKYYIVAKTQVKINLELVDFLLKKIKFTHLITKLAVIQRNLECLKYSHQLGCTWNDSICDIAVLSNSLDCLKYAIENGCPYNYEICNTASVVGSIDCLIYLHKYGCPINEHTIECAVYNGHLECLKYLHQNGTTYDKDELLSLYTNSDIGMYIRYNM